MAARHDLFIDQGTTFTRDFIYKDAGGTVIDLTGYTAQMMIRKTANEAAAPIFNSDDEAGSLVITFLEGKITLTLTDELTSAFPAPFAGLYDIELNLSGVITRLIQGNVTVDPGITRP